MPHPRKLIRDAAKALLLGQTVAGTRVHKTRAVPLRGGKLPALTLYTTSEAVDPSSQRTSPRELKRTVQLVIEGAVKATAPGEDIEDALDALAKEVERALHRDESLAGTADDSILTGTEVETAEEGEAVFGVVVLTYAVTYYAFAVDAADGPQDDFKTADIRHSLGGAQAAADQAHDVVDLEA